MQAYELSALDLGPCLHVWCSRVSRMLTRSAGLLQEMNDALKALTRMQEEATGEKVPVPAHVLELAGSQAQIPSNLRSTRSGRYGEYTPTALQGSYANENGNYRTSSGAPPR